jgi:hypothetical protein
MPDTPDQPLKDTSLDLLHDLSLPQEFGWWPPAPGWYVVVAALAFQALILFFRWFARYRMGAYRRSALQELETLTNPASIAELLRRTALAVTSRSVIANLTGREWLEWLASQSPTPMTDSVRNQLTEGVYGETSQLDDFQQLKSYAAHWIANHKTPLNQR